MKTIYLVPKPISNKQEFSGAIESACTHYLDRNGNNHRLNPNKLRRLTNSLYAQVKGSFGVFEFGISLTMFKVTCVNESVGLTVVIDVTEFFDQWTEAY